MNCLRKPCPNPKNLVRHADGFLVVVDEHGDVLQFAYYHDSVLVDVPIEEKEESLQATVSTKDYLKLIDRSLEPLGDYIKPLLLERKSWSAVGLKIILEAHLIWRAKPGKIESFAEHSTKKNLKRSKK